MTPEIQEQDKRTAESDELRVTGGYEPNDPVVMSRGEYHAALAQARREGVEAFQKRAKADWGIPHSELADFLDRVAARLLSEAEALLRWPKEGK